MGAFFFWELDMHIVEQVQDSFYRMKYLDDNVFDITITDPPYPKRCQDNMFSGSLIGKKSVPKYSLDFDPLTEYKWINHILRATRRWVVIFCTLESFGRLEDASGEENYIRSAVWYKCNSMGQLTRDRPATAYEGIAILHKKTSKLYWNGAGSYGIWKANGTRGLQNRHPNQKPDDLCRKLTWLFSDIGEHIFDPFSGSAAIGRAAKIMKRSYTGWEKDSVWVKRGNQNLALERESSLLIKNPEYFESLCSMNM
jgi:DNA modification methylase